MMKLLLHPDLNYWIMYNTIANLPGGQLEVVMNYDPVDRKVRFKSSDVTYAFSSGGEIANILGLVSKFSVKRKTLLNRHYRGFQLLVSVHRHCRTPD